MSPLYDIMGPCSGILEGWSLSFSFFLSLLLLLLYTTYDTSLSRWGAIFKHFLLLCGLFRLGLEKGIHGYG